MMCRVVDIVLEGSVGSVSTRVSPGVVTDPEELVVTPSENIRRRGVV